MYDIKHLEAGQHQPQPQPQTQHHPQHPLSDRLSPALSGSATAEQQLTCSVIAAPSTRCQGRPQFLGTISRSPIEATHMTLLTLRRRRAFQRRACLLSILAAFVFGMALGVVVPMFGLPDYFTGSSHTPPSPPAVQQQQHQGELERAQRPPSDFPSIYESAALPPYSVAFIKGAGKGPSAELSAEQVFRNVFHLEQDKNAPDSMIVKKLDTNDGSIKEFHVQRTASGRYRKGPERRLSKKEERTPSAPATTPSPKHSQAERAGLIDADVFWGSEVERYLPKGFAAEDQRTWERYVSGQGQVVRLEHGCGRMQNRMVVFADGTRACARYRQNTDQIQGEIFSYYLGQLLKISNLAPSAATVIDTTTPGWAAALGDITQAQWKERRPVVLTRWLADLEPAGIPQPFQPLERHLNKYDVWNLTRQSDLESESQSESKFDVAPGLLKRLGAATSKGPAHQSSMLEETQWQSQSQPQTESQLESESASASESESESKSALVQRLIELAQWSDLIVFDYLIANLDRVVNNLYNFQWNADIMAAPAHNLARQVSSQLLVFLDNESGLLHGYRLLKKYEAYHSLLLDNLCVFRRPTIEALQRLRAEGAGRPLRDLFERATSDGVRDVLPSLPDKSIKILMERIDRVLGQVHKCREDLNKGS
ncbi:extracellular serine/threonine protein kinase four-jointed [Drosophila guanche]|uniref:Blast:Protein four-jointed n=1 Tax=Drosophila guanche TaxID=7266 RepID=A0A3B0J2Y6_DROGU|nr:extracellular serine/threonine protein kinase four-jointed [Drosophila guanche]SPP75894.1 blast:Protein four-jointed [Drosophila guanche]